MDTNQSSFKEPSLKTFQDPTEVLKAAIVKIDTFTRSEASSLEVTEEGQLVAKHLTPLKRIIALGKCYIGSLLSDHVRQEQEKKLRQIKQELLLARDILNSHSPLISQLEEGDPSQRSLAKSARSVIERYNTFVAKDASTKETMQNYNYERNKILLDEEIRGQTIQLPRSIYITADSNVNAEKAQKTFKEIGAAFDLDPAQKKNSSFHSTHKKNEQFLRDTFCLKATRFAISDLPQPHSIAEVLKLVKQTPIQMTLENELIIMQQTLEMAPGTSISLIGSFKQHTADSKLMSMPILHSFHMVPRSLHSGFPYPSQHSGWSLAGILTEAHPLRTEQAPFFKQIDQKKKALSQHLLSESDPKYMNIAKRHFHHQRVSFDQNKLVLLKKHRQVQELILKHASLYPLYFKDLNLNSEIILDKFYEYISHKPSTFDCLTSTHLKLLEGFIEGPAKRLEKEWLEEKTTPLRTAKPQERLQYAISSLEKSQRAFLLTLDAANFSTPYLQLMGTMLGKASQAIILQYFSEKIGFPPPMLNDFERKIQMCAFQQLITFLEEMEEAFEEKEERTTERLNQKYDKDIQIFNSSTIEDLEGRALNLTNELEVYFNSRFFAAQISDK
ncbi:MAG: hypothetical protein H0V82_06180 [Candidatus Protochlamydia sp.]|nr:hypothetical protein [Candidatus Protochlamydia sp.]